MLSPCIMLEQWTIGLGSGVEMGGPARPGTDPVRLAQVIRPGRARSDTVQPCRALKHGGSTEGSERTEEPTGKVVLAPA